MNATTWFAGMSNMDLIQWWGQYGKPSQATYYRGVARRAAWAVLRSRNLTQGHTSYTYTSTF